MHLSWKKLQWLRFRRWLRQNKGPVLALVLGCAAVCLFWVLRGSKACMDWFILHFSAPWKRFFGGLAELLPFSAAELAVTIFVLWAVFMLAHAIYQKRVHYRNMIARRILCLCAALVWVYAGFCGFWGVHYYGTGFSEKSGLYPKPVSLEALENTTRFFAQGAVEASGRVQRGSDNRFAADNQQILAYGDACYEQIVQQWPFLEGPHRSPKPAGYSVLMSLSGFTGYLFPFLGESTLNVHCPNVYLPVTIAHEMAHQRGVAPEQEANFLGIAACLSCDNADYRYSGWLFGLSHLSSALNSVAPQAWQSIYEQLDEGCKADLAWNREYWQGFDSPVGSLVQTGYSGFLQSYGQKLGLKSYGACVDLLVAYYETECGKTMA